MKLEDLKNQARAAGVPGLPPPPLKSKRKVKYAVGTEFDIYGNPVETKDLENSSGAEEPEDSLDRLFEPMDYRKATGFKKGVVAFPELPKMAVRDLPKLPLPSFDKSRGKLK